MEKINDILKEIKRDVADVFISTDIVGEDGLSIGGGSNDPNFDSTAAAARFLVMMKLASKVAGKIKMGDVDDTLTTTNEVYVLTRYLGDESYYWSLVVTREATLGMVRMIMNEYVDKLWDAIPQ